ELHVPELVGPVAFRSVPGGQLKLDDVIDVEALPVALRVPGRDDEVAGNVLERAERVTRGVVASTLRHLEQVVGADRGRLLAARRILTVLALQGGSGSLCRLNLVLPFLALIGIPTVVALLAA